MSVFGIWLTVILLSVPSQGQSFFYHEPENDHNRDSINLQNRAAVERIPDLIDRYQTRNLVRDAVEKLPSKIGYLGDAKYRLSSGGNNVICHVDTTQYHKGQIPRKLEQTIQSSCTHVLLSSVDTNFDALANRWFVSQSNGTFGAVGRLKKRNPSIKMLLYVNDIMPESVSATRRDFVISVNDLLKTHGFDGIVLSDVLPRSTNELYFDEDDTYREEFPLLVEELASVLKTRGYLLGMVVSPVDHIARSYETSRLVPNLDMIILKSFDFRKYDSKVVGHHSPLYSSVDRDPSSKYHNVDYMVKYWLHKGAVPDQLVVGIALFGRSFKLEDPNYFQPGSRSAGNGYAGRWTKTPGYLSYYEVCERMKRNEWKQYSDSAGSPFLVRKDQWISYENPQSLTKKLEYVENQKLGGVMLWSIDSDDFNGMCGTPWPLVNTVKTFTTHANNYNPMKLRDVPTDSTLDKKVICYYASWSWYRVGDGKYAPEYIDKNLCTHIVYAFAALDPNELIMIAGDEWEDVENKFYERFISKLKSGNTKIMISLGGWTDSYGDKYTKLIGSGVARKKFVSSAVAFLRKHNFDGLHLDWNYPVCWQADCTQGPPSDKSNFVKLTQELRAEFNKQDPPFELSASISGYDEIIKEAYDFPNLSEYLDFMSVMTYDYHGPWENITGHVSPVYYKKGDLFPKYNMDSTIKLITRLGADPAKIVLGLPFYGQSYTLASSSEHGLGDPAKGSGTPGEYTQQPGMLAYYEICNRVYNENWQSSRDKQSGLDPYAYNGNQWVSYDDETSIRLKSEYIVKQNLGGAMVWTIDLDDFSNRCCRGAYPLLTKVNEVFQRISIKPSYSGCKKPDYPITPNVPLPTTTEEGEGSSGTWEHQMEMMTTSTLTTTTTTTAEPIQVFTKPQFRPTTSTTTEPALWTTPSVSSTSTATTTETHQHQTHSPPANRPWWSEQPTKRPEQQQQSKYCVEGSYKPSKESCQNYYQCKNGRYRRHSCKKGLLWNRSANKCDLSENTDCNALDSSVQSVQSQMTSEKPEYRPSYPMTPASSQPTPTTPIRDTTCVEGEQMATMDDCISYLLCSYGQYIKQLCPPGLAWNDQAKICDWKQNVNCENGRSASGNLQRFVDNNGNELSASGLIKIRKLPKPMFVYKQSFSECQDGQFAPHPGDCNKFLQCLWGKFNVNSCPSGLYWNAALNVCDWPYNSGCVQSEQLNVPIVGNYPTSSQVTQTRPTSKPITKPTTSRPTTITPAMESWWKPPSTTELATTENPWAWKPDSTTENSGFWKPETSNTGDPWEWKPTTTTAATLPTTESNYQLTEQYKVVCYFTNWAWYRPSAGKFFPEDTDPNLCTHIVYGFATLDYTELTIRVFDSWADIDNGFYERLVALKKRGVKVSIGLGGWNDSAGDKYSRMVNSRANRKKFINSIIKFIQKYGFQGLDVDWEYPKCWQTNCNQGPGSDKHSFSSLLIELRQAFRPYGYLLSAAVSPSKAVIDAGYDVPILSNYLDWIGVMTYDYHGQWDKKTGHVAPIYYHPEDEISYFNMNYTINYWIEKGANSRKIVLGIPLYGQSFTLSNPNVHGLNAPASGAGQAGQFTRSAGFLAYNEICVKLSSGQWNIVRDPKRRMGPYAYSGNQWVGFDDIWSVKQKADYVKTMNLGGAMIWALDLDDFRNVCGQGHYPLLTTIMKTLGYKKGDTITTTTTNVSSSLVTGSYPSYPQTVSPTEMVPTARPPMRPTTVKPIATRPPTTYRPTTMKPTSPPTTIKPTAIKPTTGRPTISTPARPTVNPSNPENFKVVCYFTNWAWYRQNGGRYLPSDVDPSLCTHIIYGFAVLDNEELIIKAHDSWADYDNLFYQKVSELKKYGIKVLLAIGGWNDSAGSKYSELVNNPNARRKFVRHVVAFIRQNNFDGLDVDWEYPKCWQVDCARGPSSDKQGFSDLLTELREAFDREGFLLSAAVSPNKAVIDAGYDVPLLSRTLDWISVMAYDYHGQWDKKTGHVAPMYSHPDDFDSNFNANFTLYYWVSKGADPRKLVMGMPTYGQSFSLASSKENGLNALTYGGGEAGEATRSRGFMAYYEICHRILKKNWRIVQDPLGTMGPYAYNGNQWVSFDDQEMIKYKSEFVVRNNLGGAMIWALDLDDFRNVCGCEPYPLLKTINRVLGRLPGPSPDCYLDLNENDIDSREFLDNKSDEKIEISNKIPSSCTEPLLRGFPEDCNKYEICQFGELSVQSCPESLYFNKKNALCDWPENVNCTNQLLSS